MSRLGSTAHTLNQLPLEILLRIFHYLDIPDILRTRRVSLYLNEVSHSRDVWGDAYRNAGFVRPPGPLPSQPALDLENALVSSFRVDRNLRYGGGIPQIGRPTRKLREIRHAHVDLVSFLFGRFLLIASDEQVRCYDLNFGAPSSDSGESIIYRAAGRTLKSAHCVSAFDVDGRPFACMVLNEATETRNQISIHLLNMGEKSEVTLELLHQFEHSTFVVQAVTLGPRVIVVQYRVGHGVDADRLLVALDVYSRTQFHLLSFTHPTWETDEMSEFAASERAAPLTSISTSTHLLLAYSFWSLAARGWRTFVRGFTLPRPNTYNKFTSTLIPLGPSHCGMMSDIYIGRPALLRDSVLDPATQDVLITINVCAFEPPCPLASDLKHGMLRLSASRASYDYGPVVGTITFEQHGHLSCQEMRFLHPSFSGTGRAFHTLNTGSGWILMGLEYNLRTGGDDSNEHQDMVIEYPSILQFLTARTLLDYDPYFGRICLAKRDVIEIFDLAV